MSKLFFGSFGIAAVTLGVLGGCNKSGGAASSSSGTFVQVDGQPVSNEKFYGYLAHMGSVQVAVQGRPMNLPVAAPLGIQAMRTLVQQQLLAEVAKDEGVLPTDKDVDAEIELRKKQDKGGDFLASAKKAGLTNDDIRDEVMNNLVLLHLQTKGVVVSPDEAKKYIKDNPKTFNTPAQVNLLLIAVTDPKQKDAADAALKKNTPFQDVAKQYSIVPTAKKDGGVFGIHNLNELQPDLQAVVKATPEGKQTDWKKDGANWIKFMVQSKTPEKPVEVTDTLLQEVERNLALQKGSGNNQEIAKKVLDKMKAAKVEFTDASPFYSDAWDSYQKQIAQQAAQQQAPHAPAGRPSGAPAPSAQPPVKH